MRKYLTPDELKKKDEGAAPPPAAAPSSAPKPAPATAMRRRAVVNIGAGQPAAAPPAPPKTRIIFPPAAAGARKPVVAAPAPTPAAKPAPAPGAPARPAADREDAPTSEVVIKAPAPVQVPPAPAESSIPRLPRDRTQRIPDEIIAESAPEPGITATVGDGTTISADFASAGIPHIPSATSDKAPPPPIVLSQDTRDYLDLHLPLTPTPLTAKLNDKFSTLSNPDTEYAIGEILSRGAECILYNGRLGVDNFCIKSIRNWKDKFLGNPRTRQDKGKLGGTSYRTKLRHLNNEYRIGMLLQTPEVLQIPVHIYGLRRIRRMGLELGWDLLMERIYGVDLSDRGLLKALTMGEKLSICIHICHAISILHAKGIIHLDIKPSNFMLERSGRVRLIDFGISVQSGAQTQGVAGTAGYFSPEQLARGQLSEVTDIFALGITFSIIFGARPLSQSAKDALNKSYRTEASQSLKEGGSAIAEIPELNQKKPLADVIRACSSYKRENRPASCQAIIRQLRYAAKKCGLTPA